MTRSIVTFWIFPILIGASLCGYSKAAHEYDADRDKEIAACEISQRTGGQYRYCLSPSDAWPWDTWAGGGSVARFCVQCVHAGGVPVTKAEADAQKNKMKAASEENILKTKDAFGYKDIKMGMKPNDIKVLGVCESLFVWGWEKTASGRPHLTTGGVCYGKRDWKFRFLHYGNNLNEYGSQIEPLGGLHTIRIDVGLFTPDFGTDLFENLSSKYTYEYGYNQRDVDLYNNREKDAVYNIFQKGMIAMVIRLDKQKYEDRVWVEYRDEKQGKELFEAEAPQGIKKEDF